MRAAQQEGPPVPDNEEASGSCAAAGAGQEEGSGAGEIRGEQQQREAVGEEEKNLNALFAMLTTEDVADGNTEARGS